MTQSAQLAAGLKIFSMNKSRGPILKSSFFALSKGICHLTSLTQHIAYVILGIIMLVRNLKEELQFFAVSVQWSQIIRACAKGE